MKLEEVLHHYLGTGLTGVLSVDETDSYASADFFEEKLFKKGAIWTLCGYADPDLCVPMGEGEFEGFLWRTGSTYVNFKGEIKPLLYDLSMITEDIENDRENRLLPLDTLKRLAKNKSHASSAAKSFFVACEIKNVPFSRNSWIAQKIPNCPNWIVQKLIEWHFNVFNLPEDLYIKKT